MKKLFVTAIVVAMSACVSQANPSTSDKAQALSGTPWTAHVIEAGSTGGSRTGADGAHLVVSGNDVLIGVGWEQSSKVTISTLSNGTWTTQEVGSNSSVEDVKLADIDGQGLIDAVSFGQGKSLKVHWSEINTPQITTGDITLVPTSGTGSQEWLSGVLIDLDKDGDVDIVAGGRRAAYPAANIKWFENPGGLSARTAANWVTHTLGVTGLTMDMAAGDYDNDGDIDIALVDRDPYWTGTGTTSNTLRGTRWFENDGSQNFTNRMIVNSVNLGEPKMFSIFDVDRDGDPDVIDGSSVVSQNSQNHLYLRTNQGDFKSWSATEVTLPSSGIGMYHDADMIDVDGDGNLDLVVTCSEAYASGDAGIYTLLSDGAGGWTSTDIGGDDGDKYDNVVLRDMDGDSDPDAVTTEQHETSPPSNNTQAGHGGGLGLLWYENPTL